MNFLRNLCLVGAALGVAFQAHAQLGGTPDAPDAIGASAGHALVSRTQPSAAYAVHSTAHDATTVREFVDGAGQVFGVAWDGAVIPDLRALLGNHFQRYSAHVQNHAQVGVREVHLEAADLVVHSHGHQGHFAGSAYLPASLPIGVTGADIR
jgi:hypothetical protein